MSGSMRRSGSTSCCARPRSSATSSARMAMSNEQRTPDDATLSALADPQNDTIAAPAPQQGQDNQRPFAGKKPKQQFRREKRDVHGWLVVDKPIGMTST